jgi:outer membrane protein assembly factor BamB
MRFYRAKIGLICALISLIFLTSIVFASSNDWAMYRQSPEHTGSTPEPLVNPLLSWEHMPIWDAHVIEAPPVVGGNRVYFASSWYGEGAANCWVYAYDTQTGDIEWRTWLGGVAHSSPAIANNIFYVTNFENLWALDCVDGSILWNTDSYEKEEYGFRIITCSPAISDGLVYFTSRNLTEPVYGDHGFLGVIHALDAYSGDTIWEKMIWTGKNPGETYEMASSPAVMNCKVYVSSYNGTVFALNYKTGEVVWSKPINAHVFSHPVVTNGVVYLGSKDHSIYALDANTGVIKWSFDTGAVVSSSPAVSEGVVYIRSAGILYALNAQLGSLKWSEPYPGSSTPAISNGILYLTTDENSVYAVDAKNGALIWEQDFFKGDFKTPPAINGPVGYVIDSSEPSRIIAFSAIRGFFTVPEYHLGTIIPLVISLFILFVWMKRQAVAFA